MMLQIIFENKLIRKIKIFISCDIPEESLFSRNVFNSSHKFHHHSDTLTIIKAKKYAFYFQSDIILN